MDENLLALLLRTGSIADFLSWETACELHAAAGSHSDMRVRLWRDRLAHRMRFYVHNAIKALELDSQTPEFSWLVVNALNRNLILAQLEMESLDDHAQWRQDGTLVDAIRMLECLRFQVPPLVQKADDESCSDDEEQLLESAGIVEIVPKRARKRKRQVMQ